ncbi:DUF2141 domain-containing protein [Aquimarina gracilis]|uniref:DUF2141 domain-containing protein n=1 Tax=Aquimarina gracilis TaxID=874422 RepID=A0ABU5ZWJ0_9FLAO|nr:DUF2141 domain-containing protein [Aquimarina gracilis]MEB3346235.1 DUF2141 domain-containing protein [Aquimarina gracilis]
MKTTLLVLTTLFLAFSTPGFAQENNPSIEVHVTNIKSNKGNISVGLYKGKDNFLRKTYKSIKVKANKSGVTVTFEDIMPGEYAISLYHDEDENEKLNTFLRIPTEPYGVSNNAKGQFGPPKWEGAKFNVESEIVVQNIKL